MASRFASYSSAVTPSTPGAPSLRVRRNASNIHSRSIRWCSEVNTRSGCFLASSAIHCRFVDRFSGFTVPPVFPAMVLIAWRPPSLRRVPASPVPRPLRYYEAASTSRRACPSPMASPRGSVRARSFVFAVALPAMFEPTAGPGALFTRRSRVPGFSVRATTGPLRFPGRPLPRLCPALRPRPYWSRLAMSSRSMLPPDPTRRRLRRFHDFEAATGLQRPLSTLQRTPLPPPGARLASGWRAPPWPGGRLNPLGRFERFQVTSILLSKGLP